jgi:oligopeptide transport system substrate-binding protein
VHAIGATTVEYKLIDPQPTFPIILSLWVTFPSPVHLLPNSSDTWPSGPEAPGELAYNGPYILTGYSSGDNVTLEPNPEWAAPAGVIPTLDRITIKFIDDLAVAANAYRSGEIDATGANVTQLDSLISEFGEGEEYFTSLSPATSGLYLQMEKPPLDKLDVRLALSRAIDRAEIARVVGQGAYEPTTTWIPETSGGLAPDAFVDAVGFDPEKARDNLTEAGFPDGEGFPELTILAIANPSSRFTAEFLQQAFKTHLNIDVKIEVVDPPTQADLFFDEQYEITFNGWVQDYPDPENWVLGQFDSTGTANHVNCNDPDIDALVEKARFNTDDAERLGQYREINELIVTRLCGVIPTRHDNNHWLIKPSIVGMRENLAGQDGLAPGDWASEYWGLSE